MGIDSRGNNHWSKDWCVEFKDVLYDWEYEESVVNDEDVVEIVVEMRRGLWWNYGSTLKRGI